jgi:hypothetical protein
MADSGVIGYGQISGSWTARKIFGDVWKAATEMSMLVDPRVCPTMSMKKLRATIPLMGNLAVQSQLVEFEHAVTKNATPAGVDITLYKDRVKLAVSDESVMESDVGDPLMIQKSAAAAELAENLETLIATQIATTPQTATTADWDSVSPIKTIGGMVGTLSPYRATAVVMDPDPFAQYVAALASSTYSIGSPEDLAKGIARVPGYNIPVFPSKPFGDASGNAVAVISANCPGVILGQGGVKVREWDNPELGAKEYQYDVWRTPLSNLRQTSSTTNKGIITCVIT